MAKSRKNPTRGGGGSARKAKAKASSFEVEEQAGEGQEKAAPAGASLETALVYVTFVALLIGLIMAQMDLGSTYGKGMFGG